MSAKNAYEKYAVAPLVSGTKQEFDTLRSKGWSINSEYVWTRRVLKTDPPFFTISQSVGSGHSYPSMGARFWGFHAALDALRFERGALNGLGMFDTSRLTKWTSGELSGYYVVVGKRVMGVVPAKLGVPGPSSSRIFNVALVGVKGEYRFKLAVGSGSITVPITPVAKIQTAPLPTVEKKSSTTDRDVYIDGYRHGFRDAMETMRAANGPEVDALTASKRAKKAGQDFKLGEVKSPPLGEKASLDNPAKIV